MRRRPERMTAMAAAVLAAALATGARAEPVRPGEIPTFSLGLMGQHTPDILKKAKADPYAPPAEPVCQALPAEIDALNDALGPDADQSPLKTNRVGKWVGGAVRGLIPHRDVIRLLTQAGKKDDELKQAAMAGWARRGYLKGLAKTLDCTSQTIATAQDAARPATTVEIVPLGPAAEPPRQIQIDEPQPLAIAAPTETATLPQE
jgi:hypothetical protein